MHAVVRALVKCQRCGWCCNIPRNTTTVDAETIAEHTGESFEEVVAKLRMYPCGYLKDNQCAVNEYKPNVCSWYPGPDSQCKSYQELADKCYVPGAMTRVCNEPELKDAYTQLILTGNKAYAVKILQLLGIEV
jgi:Fe-S-cluster containining protein